MRLRSAVFGIFAMGLVVCSCGVGYGMALWADDSHLEVPHVRIVHLDGMIADPTKVINKLIAARGDSSVKAVVLRIESPGGAVAASQEIYQAMLSLTLVKPTVASICNLGASGGYYAALGAHKIMANPGSLTGSIGVISQFTDAHELMDKVGVKMETVKSGALKDAGSPFREMGPKDRAYFQGVVDDVYRQFRADVLKRRKVDSSALDTLADGRVLSGAQAKAANLIDTLGGFEDAQMLAKRMASLPTGAPVVDDLPNASFFQRLIEQQVDGIGKMLPTSSAPVLFRLP
ncbi:MAG: hypothetical protein RL318_1877 [Fibrobacterota bacterium]|jgi:protease-4